MFKNFITIALRSLLKQKTYSLINIVGLSIGLASCILITKFVLNELSYDRFHEKSDRIYKMVLERKYPNHSTHYSIVPHSFAEVMQRTFPEVEATLIMNGPLNNVVVNYTKPTNEVTQFEENYIMFADSNFFEVFSIKLLSGDPKKALTNLSDIVVTETTAKRYFDNEDPIGKTFRIFNQEFKVSGVCSDVPENSHMKFDFLLKWTPDGAGANNENFTSFDSHTYVVLKPGGNPEELQAKFPKMVDTYAAAQIEKELGKSWVDYKKEGNGYTYTLQPLTSIHLDPTNIEYTIRPGGNINQVYFLMCVAVLIILIACINFMNLATARSSERAREVGIRKTVGSSRGQLIYQFLFESILLSLFSVSIAVLLVELALPFFNQLANKSLSQQFTLPFFLLLFAFSIIVGVLAGSYPAFVLSSFRPALVMKGKFTGSSKGSWLRNGLVVFQFCTSIILIVGTLVVYRQMNYMQRKSLGFDKDQVVVIERIFGLREKLPTFINELKALPEVVHASSSFAMMGKQNDFFGEQFTPEGSTEILTTKSMVLSDELDKTLGFEFVEGTGFSMDRKDSLNILLNETAVRVMELKNPIGKKLYQTQQTEKGSVVVNFTIIGVVKDFNFQSLKDQITPLTIQSNETFGGGAFYAYIKIKEGNVPEILPKLESIWKKFMPDQPVKFSFLDQNINRNYEGEKRAGDIFAIFSCLAIIIACFGLFGLATYTASSRTKEIGVRKVLGATVTNVVLLLSRDFAKIVLLAFVIATPIAWYLMDQWLDNFAYHIVLDVWVFLAAGILTLAIAWFTVSYQSMRAALANPVKSLRSE